MSAILHFISKTDSNRPTVITGTNNYILLHLVMVNIYNETKLYKIEFNFWYCGSSKILNYHAISK